LSGWTIGSLSRRTQLHDDDDDDDDDNLNPCKEYCFTQATKIFSAIYGTLRSITLLKKAHH
jgi:hypothetical protein